MRILLILALVAVAAAEKAYEGYQVLSVTPRTPEQHAFLRSLLDNDQLDFWHLSNALDVPAHIMVPPHAIDVFRHTMALHGMTSIVIDKNVQESVDASYPENPTPYYNYNDYNEFDVIVAELEALVDRCPSGFECSLDTIGRSVEDKDLWLLYIGTGQGSRPAHWFDATIHAREWLAPATLMNIINRIFAQADDEAIALLANNDYYFLPVMNPDGYIYTWTPSNRMWRKNRGFNSGSSCRGTDLNRNYDHNWSGPGASGNPCADTYYGDSAASEPETAATQDKAQEIADHTLSWHSVHTYGYYWLWPYGDCTLPPRADDIRRVADATCEAIENTHGTTWRCGNSCQTLYATSGGTIDYTHDQGIIYSYVPELRGNSFAPPASEIQPSFEEIWNGVVAMVNEVEAIEGRK